MKKSESNSNNRKVRDLAPFRENSAEEFIATNQACYVAATVTPSGW